MMASSRMEDERIGDFSLRRIIQVWECPICSVAVMVITPLILPQEKVE